MSVASEESSSSTSSANGADKPKRKTDLFGLMRSFGQSWVESTTMTTAKKPTADARPSEAPTTDSAPPSAASPSPSSLEDSLGAALDEYAAAVEHQNVLSARAAAAERKDAARAAVVARAEAEVPRVGFEGRES